MNLSAFYTLLFRNTLFLLWGWCYSLALPPDSLYLYRVTEQFHLTRVYTFLWFPVSNPRWETRWREPWLESINKRRARTGENRWEPARTGEEWGRWARTGEEWGPQEYPQQSIPSPQTSEQQIATCQRVGQQPISGGQYAIQQPLIISERAEHRSTSLSAGRYLPNNQRSEGHWTFTYSH